VINSGKKGHLKNTAEKKFKPKEGKDYDLPRVGAKKWKGKPRKRREKKDGRGGTVLKKQRNRESAVRGSAQRGEKHDIKRRPQSKRKKQLRGNRLKLLNKNKKKAGAHRPFKGKKSNFGWEKRFDGQKKKKQVNRALRPGGNGPKRQNPQRGNFVSLGVPSPHYGLSGMGGGIRRGQWHTFTLFDLVLRRPKKASAGGEKKKRGCSGRRRQKEKKNGPLGGFKKKEPSKNHRWYAGEKTNIDQSCRVSSGGGNGSGTIWKTS